MEREGNAASLRCMLIDERMLGDCLVARERSSYLALDVYSLEGRGFCTFKKPERFASEKSDFTFFALIKEALSAVVTDESSTFVVRFEAKLFGNETQLDVGLIPWFSVSPAAWCKLESDSRDTYV